MITLRLQQQNETQIFHRDTGVGPIVRLRSEFGGTGEASTDAHCRLFVRQLSVQHPEGREPSRLRTETQGDRGNRLSERPGSVYAQA